MYRGKIMVTAVAVFAIGAAFAAPTSTRADRLQGETRQPSSWTPGTNGVIAAYETNAIPLAPTAVSRYFGRRHAPGLPRREPRVVPVV